MIISFALTTIEKILNGYLHLDPESERRLQAAAGKVVALDLGYFNCKIFFLITKDGMHLTDTFSDKVDVTMRGSPLDFLRFNFGGSSADLFASDIQVTGDTDAAQQFKEIFAYLDIDWEEQLSKMTGDVVAHQIGNFLRSFSKWAKQSVGTLHQDLMEYVHEEARWFPPREELQDFFQAVDQLRNDVERIEKRIERLM